MKTSKGRWALLVLLGVILAIGSILGINRGDRVLGNADRMVITTREGEKLVGHLYVGSQPAGILLLEGFGSDQVTMKSIASEFARLGVNVFTFDFSGHGRSVGGLGFDNAETDRLAKQALVVKDHFVRIANLESEQIIVLGHSLGARVALQAATMDADPPAGLILLGTQVNLSTNVQSEFFTGVSDADLEWVQNLSPENPKTKILMVSGAWDDVLTPVAAEALIQKLGGENLWTRMVGTTLDNEYSRELVLLPKLLHNYEPFSARVLSLSKMWATQVWELLPPFTTAASPATHRVLLWITGFAGLLLGVAAASRWNKSPEISEHIPSQAVKIINLRKFLIGKLLLWIAAIPLMGVVMGMVFIIPLNKPVFNLIYVGFIGGYGVMMWLLYRLGKMPGVVGQLPFARSTEIHAPWPAIGIAIVLLIITAAYGRTGWFYVFPINERVWWLLIFTPVTALGFWMGLNEMILLENDGYSNWITKTALSLIGLVPFFIYAGLMAVIGSLSGLVAGAQGLLILWLVLSSGTLLYNVSRRPWLTALIQAILLYWLILPQGVLFL